MFELKDKIYGSFQVESDIKQIIESSSLQRLKDISQFGIPAEYYHMNQEQCYSRFEHSVGVMLLLRYLNASKEEQIAGLTHDVSHTAFSHVVDWITGDNTEEDYQDNQHQEYFAESELPEILSQLGYNPKVISDESNFPLLEREIPNLCADRIDYLFREIPLEEAKSLVNNLMVYSDEIIFENKNAAAEFANYFLDKQTNHWGSYEAVVRYRLLADALRKALEEKILDLSSFWETEELIIRKLENCNNHEIKALLNLLKKDSLKDLPQGDKVEHKKFRYVDPKFSFNDELVRLGRIDEEFKSRLKEERKKNKQGVVLPGFSRCLNSE